MNAAAEQPSALFRSVVALDRSTLEHGLRHGERPDIAALLDWQYRGLNVGREPRLLRLQKFVKGFWRLPDGTVRGYNLHAQQNGPDAAWNTAADARPFGFFSVTPVAPATRDSRYPAALLLDYCRGGNGPLSVVAMLRDYLVRAAPGADDVLLGKAYLALGRRRVALGYFVLERFRRAPGDMHVLP